MSTPPPAAQIPAPGEGTAVCIPNISTRQRLKRLRFGLVSLVVGLATLAWLVAAQADRLWRLPLFLLFFGATVGFFQWRDKT